MSRHRKVYLDRRGRRAASGFVVASTNHEAASANGPTVRQRFELDGGVLTLEGLPPNTYLLAAELTGADGETWSERDHLTVED